MAGRAKPRLQRIDHNRPIDAGTDREFLFQLKLGLLLALKEQGRLAITQYQCAEEMLRGQEQNRKGDSA